MSKDDLPDQSLINLEAYVMGTNPPQEIVVNFAKALLELRRRRFDEIGAKMDLTWRKHFATYGKHLPVCKLLWEDGDYPECTCGFLKLMEQVKYV